MKKMSVLIAALGAIGAMGVRSGPQWHEGRTASPVQERMRAKRLADAPRRAMEAAEIAEWNRNVKRRNQRFVARQLARGRAA